MTEELTVLQGAVFSGQDTGFSNVRSDERTSTIRTVPENTGPKILTEIIFSETFLREKIVVF